ncbi:MAG TPA: glycoside hydrolase family 3 C-terminal domain-containing protein [Acidimicrobiales bacterium]|nr:glycoside hydrolase family 3 C-terminal domain-containing protein [Acidimicrobiales bacterium]
MGRSVAVAVIIGSTLVSAHVSDGTTAGMSRCGDVVQRPWCNTSLPSLTRARLLASAMSTSDKVTLLTGRAIPRVGIPALKFTDGALGVRGGTGDTATALPSGTSLAASFNPFDAYLYGAVVGRDARALGFDGVWGPTVNLMRTPLGGRTYEAYGEDPFLTAATGVGWIEGAQSKGIMADVKHFVANDDEGDAGVPLISGTLGGRLFVNVNVDQRTLHEIYLTPFEAALQQGHAASAMCGYSRVNSAYDCENASLLKGTVEHSWGFPGFVMSDAGAAHNVVANLNNGLDFDIADSAYNAPEVDAALDSGLVSIATLDAHVIRILQTLFAFGFFDRVAYTKSEQALNTAADGTVAERVEESGITLLQNNDDVLPLSVSKDPSIAVIGQTAATYVRGSGSSEVSPTSVVTPLGSIVGRVGRGSSVTYNDGSIPSHAAAVARAARVALVFVRDSETEGSDKLCMSLDCPSVGLPDLNNGSDLQYTAGPQNQLIAAVARANPNTVVVLETGAPVLTPWRNEVKGVVEAWYPGQQGGNAIARVLFGDADPGGRLPVTFPAQPSQLPTAGDLNSYPGTSGSETYAEGVFTGYRWFDAHGYAPAFPFGFGLSYATFSYHDLRIAPVGHDLGSIATVTMQVTNTGTNHGDAVPELYLSLPSQPGTPQPLRVLRGYQKVSLAPGQTATVTFSLNDRSFAYWDTAANGWKVAPGCYRVAVGSSSAATDLLLNGSIARLGASCADGTVDVTAPDQSASPTSMALPDPPVVTYSGS